MKQFFASRFFIILLITTIVLVTVPSVLSVMGLSGYVRNALNVALTAIQHPVNAMTDAIEGFSLYFTEFDRLRDENIKLREKLSSIEDKLYNAALLEDDNEWLRTYLGLRREHTDYELEAADIDGRGAVNYITVFTLNRGSLHGIEANMPVITPHGIVGHIAEVGLTWSKVSTLIDTSSSIGVYIERSGEVGLVEGDYLLKEQGLCKLTYLASDADIAVGDRVLSRGIGSLYPRGLLVGEIVEITPDAYSRNMVAKVRIAADTSSLSRVMIVKSFTVYTE